MSLSRIANKEAIAREAGRPVDAFPPELFWDATLPLVGVAARPPALTPTARRREAIRRGFDLLFAGAVLLVGSPVFLLITLLVGLTTRGPIFYGQTRVGRYGSLFRCYKFRTMVPDADSRLNGMMSDERFKEEFTEAFKLKDDPRLTRVGRILRKTSLDELPQFYNVLRGQMSVVGPRPVIPPELLRYGRYRDRLLTVRPGITGLWQVSGRNNLPYPKRVALDMHYIEDQSLTTDLAIIFRTLGQVLKPNGNGAY
jgi:lipopolysaccharide/colanic/teichoic acid biosynthesis glycosyltransferase